MPQYAANGTIYDPRKKKKNSRPTEGLPVLLSACYTRYGISGNRTKKVVYITTRALALILGQFPSSYCCVACFFSMLGLRHIHYIPRGWPRLVASQELYSSRKEKGEATHATAGLANCYAIYLRFTDIMLVPHFLSKSSRVVVFQFDSNY